MYVPCVKAVTSMFAVHHHDALTMQKGVERALTCKCKTHSRLAWETSASYFQKDIDMMVGCREGKR